MLQAGYVVLEMRTLGGDLVMKAELMGRVDAPPRPHPVSLSVSVSLHMHVEARSQVPMLFFRC